MNDSIPKRCTKCNQKYPRTTEFFHASKRYSDGLHSECKACSRIGYRKYWDANKHVVAKRRRQVRLSKPDKLRAQGRSWSKKHPESSRARTRRYKTKHPEQVRKDSHIRRARKAKVPYTLTETEWENILAEWRYSCAYCGKGWAETDGPLHRDHIIPLVQGGGYTKENIVPACGSCNLRKNGRTPEQAGMKLLRVL